MTGTQQLSQVWNNMRDSDRDFYSKRVSISNPNGEVAFYHECYNQEENQEEEAESDEDDCDYCEESQREDVEAECDEASY